MQGIRLIAVLSMAALLVVVALPMTFVALQAVFPYLGSGSFREPFGAWATLLDARVVHLLGTTLQLGLGVALVSAIIGVPLGALRGLFRVPGARLWDALFLTPFLLPPYIAALSWMMALQPRGYLWQVAGFDLGGLLFSFEGIVLVMALETFPVVYFAVSRSMAATGGRLADVARVCGATPWRAFCRITLPLSLPALAASLLLAFMLAIEEYGVPAALGPAAGVQVLTTAIERRLADWPIDLASAALLSLVLVALAMTAFAVQRAVLAGKRFDTETGKPVASGQAALGTWRWPVLVVFAVVAVVAVAVPVASVLATGLLRTISGGLAWDNLTLSHFASLFRVGEEAIEALGTSLSLALGAALCAGALGALSAWCFTGGQVRGATAIETLSLLPASLPSVVVGVGLILAWNQPWWPVTPYGTWVILLLSYTCLLLPYPVRYVAAALARIGPGLEAAARVHGAGAGRALAYITLPLVLPSLLAAMLMVFAVSSRELVTSLLLAPAGLQTVSIYVWRQFEQGSVGQGMAMAAVAMAVSLVLMVAALRLQRGGAHAPG